MCAQDPLAIVSYVHRINKLLHDVRGGNRVSVDSTGVESPLDQRPSGCNDKASDNLWIIRINPDVFWPALFVDCKDKSNAGLAVTPSRPPWVSGFDSDDWIETVRRMRGGGRMGLRQWRSNRQPHRGKSTGGGDHDLTPYVQTFISHGTRHCGTEAVYQRSRAAVASFGALCLTGSPSSKRSPDKART
jgi:hypothetical protein